mmetsp:Transcript_63939/g.187564  ORF Transcript_63939/g.187564 Transcript_63939/m.187564 type:complete len:304 (-) Transcript_63939:78-989(-)
MASKEAKEAQLKKLDEIDIGAIVVKTATHLVKERPVSVSMWAFGLLLAAFATGFSVDDATRENYSVTLSHAQEVDRSELAKALRHLSRAEDEYYNAKGWFWSCDRKCGVAKDKAAMARAEVGRVQKKRDEILTDARREVGIWSTFGVRDVRDSFWSSWKAGKDWASRMTMMDGFMMMMGGGEEEHLLSIVMKIVMQYIVNLTMGLVGAFGFFVYNAYTLVCAYGEPALSGIAFFLLVLVAGMATVGTYLVAIYGTVAGGGLFLVKQAAKQAALNEGREGQRPQRRVQYQNFGGGNVGGRPHYD